MTQDQLRIIQRRQIRIPYVLIIGLVILIIGQSLFKPPLKLIEPSLQPPVIVTHVEKEFAGASLVARNIHDLIINSDVVFILDQDIKKTLVLDTIASTFSKNPFVKYRLDSSSGEHDIHFFEDHIGYFRKDGKESAIWFEFDQVILVGGYFNACQKNTFKYVLTNNHRKHLVVIFPMDCVFYGDKRTLLDQYKINYKENEKDFLKYIDYQYLQGIENYKLFSKIDQKNLVIICVANERIDK